MFEKVKKFAKEHQAQIITVSINLTVIWVYGYMCYKMGAAHTWPPKQIETAFFTKDGVEFMLINGEIFKLKA